jgi:IS30 family transposase
MEQINCNTKKKKYKHILRDDRYVIEQMLKAKQEETAILAVIGCSKKTLEREIKRGTWEYLDSKTYELKTKYSYDVSQRKHDEKAKNKGRYAKINDEPELREFIETQIKKHKYSPERRSIPTRKMRRTWRQWTRAKRSFCKAQLHAGQPKSYRLRNASLLSRW